MMKMIMMRNNDDEDDEDGDEDTEGRQKVQNGNSAGWPSEHGGKQGHLSLITMENSI